MADRLTALGYDVVAHVAAGRDAVDAVRRFEPDAVVMDTQLSDGLGVLAAQAVTRSVPGVAALVLSAHPAVMDPAMRPRWGAVSLLPAGAEAAALDAGVREAVARARALAHPEAATLAFVRTESDAAVGDDVADEIDADGAVDVGAALDELDESSDAAVGAVVDDEIEIATEGEGETDLESDVATDVVGDELSEVEDDSLVVERAIEAVVERAGLTPGAALALMEQEADDTGQTLVDVARAMLA